MTQRRSAREAALKVLYQCEILRDNRGNFVPLYWEHFPAQDAVRRYADRLISGTLDNVVTIDGWIERSADNWRLDRISVIDRNILRMAIYELLFVDDVPPKVTINEAVEIAKRYSGEQACGFVNGILDRVLRDSSAQAIDESAVRGA